MIGRLRDLAERGQVWRIVSGLALPGGAVGLLAVPALLLMDPGAWMMQSEGSKASFAPFDGEPELAIAIARMYAESAAAAPGAVAAAQGLRCTRELASARIAPHRTEVFDELDKREAQLAAMPQPRAARPRGA